MLDDEPTCRADVDIEARQFTMAIWTDDHDGDALARAPAQPRASHQRANVLVAYGLLNHPLRSAVEDHLYSFGRFSQHRVFYINLAVRDIPQRLRETHFDLVIFHTSLLATRWTPWLWRKATGRALALPRRGEVRVAMPQDEFLRAQLVSEFVREADINVVFSVAPEAQWPRIYPDLDRDRVRFHRVLTGYLDEYTLGRIERLTPPIGDRPVAVGYRAWSAPPWLGRHGQLKVTVAERVRQAALERGLPVDVSTRSEDALIGDEWFGFLGRCRYQLGVEGGASILDADGSIKDRTEVYLADHPRATFEEVEAACFPGRDGELGLFALSPRHLEACATRTCQVLVEGTYNSVLQPGVHYLELKRDFSNLAQTLGAIQSDAFRAEMVDNAYRDIVLSGHYTYRSFVEEIERVALSSIAPHDTARDQRSWQMSQRLDRLSWHDVALRVRALELSSRLFGPTARRIRYARRRRAAAG